MHVCRCNPGASSNDLFWLHLHLYTSSPCLSFYSPAFFQLQDLLAKKKKRTESVKVPDLPQKRFRHMNTDTGLYGLKVSAPLTAKREFSVCSKYRGCVILLVLSKYFRIIQGIIYLYTCLMCNQTVRKKMFLVPGSSLQNRFQNNK